MTKLRKARKRVEIYFVLYLVALVLLMPSPNRTDGKIESVDQSMWRIDMFPEKIRLECAIERDSANNVSIVSADTVNVIRYSPALTDVHLRAVVEDVVSKQVLVLDESNAWTSSFASVQHDLDRGLVVFRWNPLPASKQSASFRVTVFLRGRPAQVGQVSDSMMGQTQFVLSTIVNNQQPPQIVLLTGRTDTLVMRDTSNNQFAQPLGSEFWLEPARTTIICAAGKEWTNRISIGGADPARDLQGLPSAKIVSGPQLEIVRYLEQRTLVIKGRAPVNGISVIQISATRADGKLATSTFSVQTIVTATPRLPDAGYPGVEVVIDPLLPSVENARALLRDGIRELASVPTGLLRFRPSNADTGRAIEFVRIIDGQEEYTSMIPIRAFPSPVVREIRRGTDANLKTVVVQFYSADRSSNRPSLRIVDGNASSVRKLAGYLRPADNQKPTVSWIEVFEVSRKDATKPFSFRVQATDDRGRTSAVATED